MSALREAIRKAAGEPTGEELEEALRMAGQPSMKAAMVTNADGCGITYLLIPTNITAVQLPCHDPPVAWIMERRWGQWPIRVICCPSMPLGQMVPLADARRSDARYMDVEPIVLDAEPGRRP